MADARTFDYDSLTDEQKAKFMAALSENPDFSAALASKAQTDQGLSNTLFNAGMEQVYSGNRDIGTIDRGMLTNQAQKAAFDASSRALSGYDATIGGSGNLTDGDIGEFVRGMYNLETRAPDQFQLLMQNDPQMALRYFASMGTGRYMVNQVDDFKPYRTQAEQLGYQMGVDAGFGDDGMKDGKSFASGYGTQWADVNSEGGRGDFLKLGTVSATNDGVLNWVEDNPLEAAAMVGSAFVPGGALWAAGYAGANTAIQGGDFVDVLKSAGLAGATSGLLGDIPGFGDTYSAQNFGGAFVRGATNNALGQAVWDQDLDIKDALISGGIQMGAETIFDLFGDARQTNDGNLEVGIDTVDQVPITQDQVDRLTNTTDLFGALGPDGFLSQMGIDLASTDPESWFTADGYLRTGAIGDTLDAIDSVTGLDFGGRPVVDPDGKARQEAEDALAGIQERNLPFEEASAEIDTILNKYYTDTSRYDERFFDLTSERGASPMTGIWETNPVASTSSNYSLPGNTTSDDGGYKPQADSVNYGEAVIDDGEPDWIDPTQSTIGEDTIPDSDRELVLGAQGEFPDFNANETGLPESTGEWTPDWEWTPTDGEYIPDTQDIPDGGGGGSLPSFTDITGGGGDFEPDWTELFPYTKLTPLQKKALRPYTALIAAMREGGVA